MARTVLARHGRVRAVSRRGVARLPPDVEIVRGDATDSSCTREICHGASVVYHCAGAPYAEWPATLPRLMAGIIEGASDAGAKLVYADNLYGYGPVNGPLFESLPDRPAGPKGAARARVTRQLLDAHREGRVRAVIGRASDFYGPGVRLSALGERVFAAALANRSASVLGDVDAAHSFSYIGDFAASLVKLGEHDEAMGAVWHVPHDVPLTMREMLVFVYGEAQGPGHPGQGRRAEGQGYHERHCRPVRRGAALADGDGGTDLRAYGHGHARADGVPSRGRQ